MKKFGEIFKKLNQLKTVEERAKNDLSLLNQIDRQSGEGSKLQTLADKCRGGIDILSWVLK